MPISNYPFKEKIRLTPNKPGIYTMRDINNTVIYVGKAAKLRNRIRSYFTNNLTHTRKVELMISKIDRFEYILTETEQEALILENNLIKQLKPWYNVRLKDDKTYPFIKIDLNEDYPLVYITRVIKNDGAKYFGPYANAGSVRKTLKLLKRLFPYRSCTKTITGKDKRPCLDYFINRCLGPCIGAVDKKTYLKTIEQVIYFLEGKTKLVTKHLKSNMLNASEQLDFETAALLRDQISSIENVNQTQRVLSHSNLDRDVFAMEGDNNEAWIEVFFIRQGKLIGRDNFIMNGTEDEDVKTILTAFVKQYYSTASKIPNQIIVQYELDEQEIIKQWLMKKRGHKVSIVIPLRGEKRKLMQMVAQNAKDGLSQYRKEKNIQKNKLEIASQELQEYLNLPSSPNRIECFDISNIQGTNATGSMVVFEKGKPLKTDYRKFKIKTIQGIDDYSMIKEMLARRYKYLANKSDTYKNPNVKQAWSKIPDLVIIDGGKGHLSAAKQVFLELGIDYIFLSSLAKENEELYITESLEPIVLPRNSQALFLIQRIRDEAHRFAITYHRKLRSKNSLVSKLDKIPGIGPKKKEVLYKTFGTIDKIGKASIDDLIALNGFNLKLAKTLKKYF